MTKKRNPYDGDQPVVYHIRLQGQLDRRWIRWFGDVTIDLDDDGSTLLTCSVVDQAALYGLLRKIRDLGMPLISVTRVGSDPTGAGDQTDQPAH